MNLYLGELNCEHIQYSEIVVLIMSPNIVEYTST